MFLDVELLVNSDILEISYIITNSIAHPAPKERATDTKSTNPQTTQKMPSAIKPITGSISSSPRTHSYILGKLRKNLIVDLSVAFGLGIAGGYAFWFGYHTPSVRRRDAYYAKLEAEGAGMHA